jgi:uncharacterized membrane protein YbhN (UPF0104 family)
VAPRRVSPAPVHPLHPGSLGEPSGCMPSDGPWRGRYVAATLILGAVLALGGSALVIILAGHSQVRTGLAHADWIWLVAGPFCVLVSHAGYVVSYRAVARVDRGPELLGEEAAAMVTTGFGPLSPRGGFSMDAAALRTFGLSRKRAALRVRTLGMFEYAVLAPVTFGAASYMAAAGRRAQTGLLPSWIIGVPAGTAVALTLLFVYRRAGRPRSWWSPVRHALDSIEETLQVLRSWPDGGRAVGGMVLYWAADIGALVACAAVFTHRHSVGFELVVGYASGYALTRRTLPLAGAGIVEALLPFALHWVGYPLATAVLSVVAYRVFNVWLVIFPAVAGLRRLRSHLDASRRAARRRRTRRQGRLTPAPPG